MTGERLRRLRVKWSARWVEWPLLRVLLFDPWFRVAFVLFIGLLAFLGLFLPKIWRSSPKQFSPVVRVSGLDFVQAWSLARAARKSTAQGAFEDAEYAWQAAVANNPADPDKIRGLLELYLLDSDRRPQRVSATLPYVPWLLRLSRTNEQDLRLAARLYERFRLEDYLVALLSPRADEMPPSLEPFYLKGLFHTGLMEAFGQRLERAPAGLEASPEMALYAAAFQAGWGPIGTRALGRATLDSACDTQPNNALAQRLRLAVSERSMDAERYRISLERLEACKQDRLQDHIGYWRILEGLGKLEQARQLAVAYRQPPAEPLEAMRRAHALRSLGLRDAEIGFWRDHVTEVGNAPMVWLSYGDLLISSRRWEELRVLARQIRAQDGMLPTLGAYSYFLEGRAEMAQGRWTSAEEAFDQAATLSSDDGNLALDLASRLDRLGYPRPARRLLERLAATHQDEVAFWQREFSVAAQLKDWQTMLRAAERCYALRPDEVANRNNVLAMWLLTRQKPEESWRLSLELVLARPEWATAKINRSLALVRNHRAAEAATLLSSMVPDRLLPEEANGYHWCWLEYHLLSGDTDKATALAMKVDQKRLFGPELEWLKGLQAKGIFIALPANRS